VLVVATGVAVVVVATGAVVVVVAGAAVVVAVVGAVVAVVGVVVAVVVATGAVVVATATGVVVVVAFAVVGAVVVGVAVGALVVAVAVGVGAVVVVVTTVRCAVSTRRAGEVVSRLARRTSEYAVGFISSKLVGAVVESVLRTVRGTVCQCATALTGTDALSARESKAGRLLAFRPSSVHELVVRCTRTLRVRVSAFETYTSSRAALTFSVSARAVPVSNFRNVRFSALVTIRCVERPCETVGAAVVTYVSAVGRRVTVRDSVVVVVVVVVAAAGAVPAVGTRAAADPAVRAQPRRATTGAPARTSSRGRTGERWVDIRGLRWW
jgi:hypothetical protein